MDYSNKEEVFKALIDWEQENGEDILDTNFGYGIELPRFMAWAVGAKYITSKQFEAWYDEFIVGEAEELINFLYDRHQEIEYALVSSEDGEWSDDDYYLSFRILAHFISDFRVYRKKLEAFLNNGVW